MSQPTIRVRRGPHCWIGDFREASDAAEVLELFGAYELPLPFTPSANPVDVAELLTRRNPDHIIIVEGASGR